MLSPDGHTRTFDAQARRARSSATAWPSWLLKRLRDAVPTGTRSTRCIRGAAVNNDGGRQGELHRAERGRPGRGDRGRPGRGRRRPPHHLATSRPTAPRTPLGDPIEVEALTQAFRPRPRTRGFCAIGSVKSNVGHLVIAAGAAGLIKTALALTERRIPPTLHFETPNPKIDFEATPVLRGTASASTGRPGPRRAAPA